VLSILFANTGIAQATSLEKSECEAQTVTDVTMGNVKNADYVNSDIDQARNLVKTEEGSDPDLVSKFIQGEGLILPDFAEGVTTEGVPRRAYGIAIDNEFLVVPVEKKADSSDEVVHASLSLVSEDDNNSFKVDGLVDSQQPADEISPEAIGNCPVGKTWHCTAQRGDCIEKHCARCTYLLHWKAVVLCAVVACPYVANYTCCTAGHCVPRMIR